MRFSAFALLFLMTFSTTLLAQKQIPLYEKAQKEEAVLFIYTPDSLVSKNIGVLVVPGGGYASLAMQHEGHDVANELVNNGYTAIVLKYRLPQALATEESTMRPLMDVQNAFLKIRQQQNKLGINIHKLGILGFSAGGHLAGSASTLYAYQKSKEQAALLRPDFTVLLYPVVTMDSTFTHQGSRRQLLGSSPTPENVQFFSVEKNISPDTPPMYVMHAKDDQGVKCANSEKLIEQLMHHHIPYRLFAYDKGGHGFGLINPHDEKSWFDDMLIWLKDQGL